MRRFNWPLWTGFILSIVAFASYLLLFSRFPATRDVPWVNWLLFAIAIVLLIAGVRRAQRKILPGIITALGLAVSVFTICCTRERASTIMTSPARRSSSSTVAARCAG